MLTVRVAMARVAISAATCVVAVFAQRVPVAPSGDWPTYGHDPGGMRYSPLAKINRDNVGRLTVAWTYHARDMSDGRGGTPRSGFETTPLVVDGALYLTTAFNRVIALDPETGRERWAYDPQIDLHADYGDGLISRGLATWVDPSRRPGQPCRRRLFEATNDARLVALDAAGGKPCTDFGSGGVVSLRDVPEYVPGTYHMTSPPTVVDDIVVVGSGINDNQRAKMASGVVRAFDVRTGAQRWSWNPLPNTGGQTGAANAWSVMAADPERHLVFVPTGSASPDYYGGLRPGDNKWADSIVALRAQTGELAWGFQLVHHDLWDYDTASPPLLTTIVHDRRPVPVVVQGNKTGYVYVLNRDTGVPVFPVEEVPVPKSDVPGEAASPTQPIPTILPPVAPHRVSADDAWGADRDACGMAIRSLRTEGVFTPPSVRGTLVMPGMVGGMNWSGSAFDPSHHLLIANSNALPAKAQLIPRDEFSDRSRRAEDGDYANQAGTPYGLFRRFLQGPSGFPCNRAPWGVLTAIDLETGATKWQVPLGSMQGFGGSKTEVGAGSVSLGGPIVTAGGVVFIGGTVDGFLRAFDVETGRELWKGRLPTPGHATPMTYQLTPGGRQFVVIAAGGHAKISEEPIGDTLVAFALEQKH